MITNFKLVKEHKEKIKLSEIVERGWVEMKQYNSRNSRKTFFFKGNYVITVYENRDAVNILEIFAKDITLIDWLDPQENFKVTIKCPTIEVFDLITNLI